MSGGGEVLRQAAALMRADAEKATPGRWKAWGVQALADQDGTSDVDTAVPVASTFACDDAGRPRTYDLDHIIGMQPVVALAVADLLEALAQRVEDICDATPTIAFGESVALNNLPGYPAALAVAVAYLGEATP